MINASLRHHLARLLNRENLTRREAGEMLEAMLADDASDAQIAAALIALAAKGETVDELAGLAEALRARAVKVTSCHALSVDTAGTGSSQVKTFNVSTAAAFVCAGAGLAVAKHGNRAASSKSGSADVLTALGVNVNALTNVAEDCLNQIGICFMFAPLFHGATARVASIRRDLGVRTTFNLLGPLSNPAGAPRQVIGVWRKEFVELLAQVTLALGTERAWVVHGEDGLDEITLAGKTFVAEAHEGAVRTFEVAPQDFGLTESSLEHLQGGNAETNAQIISDVLTGKRRDEARTLVVINAAAAIFVGGKAATLQEAADLAAASIDRGAASQKLEQLVKATNRPSANGAK
jgi:anthranilate phosphoribosyltransferase